MDIRDYLASPARTLVEIAAAVASLVLEVEGVPLKPSAGHPGLVSLDPLRVSVPARSVASGSVPYRVWQAVAERSGLSVRRCRQAVALLKLPDEALALIHDHRLSEPALRPILRMTDAKQQIAAVGALVSQATHASERTPETGASELVGPPPTDRAAHQTAHVASRAQPAEADDLTGLLVLVEPIHSMLSQASPQRRQAWAERLARDPAAAPIFVTLMDGAGVLRGLLQSVYAAADAGDTLPAAVLPTPGVAIARSQAQRQDGPLPEVSDPAVDDLRHLVTLVIGLQQWLSGRADAALQAIVQQLRGPGALGAFEMLDETASHLYRILAAAVAGPGSHHLDGLTTGNDQAHCHPQASGQPHGIAPGEQPDRQS